MRIPAVLARATRGDQPLGRLLRPLVNRLLPFGPKPVRVLSGEAAGLRLMIEPKSEKFYWTGAHEPEVQGAIKRCLGPGAIFWDVGAHIGFFSLMASRLVGPTGQVHAFEPLQANIKRLRESVALNPWAGNVTVHPWAIAATRGEAFFQQVQSSLMGSLGASKSDRQALVICVTLDAMAEEIRRPHLIKIDVEGTEDQVLAGGRDLLKRDVPTIIVEFLNVGAVTRARAALPQYQFLQLDATNWLLSRTTN